MHRFDGLRRAGLKLLHPSGGLFAMLQTVLVQGATVVVNLATGIITARLLGPVGRGEFAAVGLWLIVPPMLATAGLQSAVVYFTRHDPEGARFSGITGLVAASLVFVPICAGFYWFAPQLMHGYSASIVTLARIIMVLSVVNVWSVIGRQGLLAVKNFRAFNATGYGASFVYLLLLLPLVVLGAVTPHSAAYAQFAGTALVLIPTFWWLVREWRERRQRAIARVGAFLRYGVRAAPIDIVTVLSGTIDRVVLVGLVSASDFGIYAVALSFARILYVVQTAVSSVMLTDLSARPSEDVQPLVHQTFKLLLWGLIGACGLCMMVDRRLLGLVYGPAFVAATPVFRVLLVEGAITCLAQLLIQAYLSAAKPGIPAFWQVVTFGLAALGMLALTPYFGVTGAAVSLAFASSVRLLVLLAGLPRIGLALPNPCPRTHDLRAAMQFLSRVGNSRRAAEGEGLAD
jgi:enterobacterial common antigen flippase